MTAPRFVTLALAGALLTCPVVAIEVTMTQEERDTCEAQGGCEIVTMKIPEYTIQQRADGQWDYRLRGANGETMSHGEGYKTAGRAIAGARAAKRRASQARIVVRDAAGKIVSVDS